MAPREESAQAPRGVTDDNIVQRHEISHPTRALPSNVEGYDRQGTTKVAAQFIFEYLATSAVSASLDTDVIHDVPRE
eukprot:7264823-Pyramimonas_sp.AAC.1